MMDEKWGKKKIGDLVTFQRGHDLTVDSIVAGIYPVVGSSGIIGFHNKPTSKGPGVTIGRSGNSVGKPFFVEFDFWAHNTILFVKEFKNTHPKFFYYFLKTLHLKSFDGGSAVPTLNRNHIHELEVFFPESIEIQRRIAAILTALDDKIELNRRMNETLEGIAQALWGEWFGKYAGGEAEFNGAKKCTFEEHLDVERG